MLTPRRGDALTSYPSGARSRASQQYVVHEVMDYRGWLHVIHVPRRTWENSEYVEVYRRRFAVKKMAVPTASGARMSLKLAQIQAQGRK